MKNFNFLSNLVAENEVNRALAAEKNEVNRDLVAEKTLQNAGGGTSRHKALIIAKQFSQYCVSRSEGAQVTSARSAVDVPMTSYGAPDEHPMSIRSASDGERWQNRVWKYVAMIFAVLVMSMANIGMAWGDTFTDTHTVPTANTGLFSKIVTGDGASFGNSSLQTTSNGGTGSFTISTTDGSYISGITFTATADDRKPETFTSSDGTISNTGQVYTFTPSTATKTSCTFTMKGASGKTVRFAPVAVSLTSEYEYFSMNFSISSGTVSCTKSNGSSDVTITSTGGVSSNMLQVNNGKNLVLTSSAHNIQAIHFSFENHADKTYTASTGTYSSNTWTSNSNTQTVTFSSSASTNIVGFSVELVDLGATHTVTAATDNASYGTAAAAKTTVAEGATTTITATPKSGYAFDHWTVSGTGATLSSTTTNPTTLTMGKDNATVTAYFVERVCPSSGILFSLGGWSSSNSTSWVTANNSTVVITGLGTLSGGTVTAVSIESSKTPAVAGSGDNTAYSLGYNSVALYCELDCPLQAGDEITIVSNGSHTNKFILTKTNSRTTSVSTSVSSGTNTYVVTGSDILHGQNKLYIWRENNTLNIKTINISRSAATCTDKYSFHYGPASSDWETPICFEKVGSTHEWNITTFTIPDHTNGQFYVGYEGATNGQSVTKAWTDSYSDGNGAMKLLPTSSSIVGQATGAVGTINIWDDSGWKNQNVGFTPNGYGITYGGSGHAFHTTATDHMLETDVATLPDVSTTYTMGLATATSGTYVTCAHSSTAEAISNMGVTNVAGGKKAIYLVPGSFNAASAKYAVWDGTNSAFDGFMTDADGDGIYVGYVGSNCSTINLVRLNSNTTDEEIANSANNYKAAWDKKWNQTADITISGDLAKKYTITNMDNGNECGYSTANMQPITSQKGKFRMWDNSADQNWYVHWIPYYVLSYNANGGSGAPEADYVSVETDPCQLTVSSTEPTRTDYVFQGWNPTKSTADAGTKDDAWDPSDTHAMTGDVTLYAVWQACSGPNYTAFNKTGTTDNTHNVGDELGSLSVTAAPQNGGTLSYQWYQYDDATGKVNATVAAGTNNAATYNIPNDAECTNRHYYCVISESGCSTTVESAISGALTLTEPVDPCDEPAKVANEIARFFVPCGLSNATSGDPSAWEVTNQDASTEDNTFTTNDFGGNGTNWYRNETSGLIYGKLTGNSGYIQLKLKSGNFQAGDVVTAYFNRNDATKTGLTLKTQGSSYAITPANTAAGVETSGSYTLVADAIESDGSIKLFRANSSSYVNRIIVTRVPASASVTATLLTPAYMPTGASGVQIGVEITGASTGWYYRVKKGGGYETPDETTYTTTTWTMTSTIGSGTNTYTVELYNGSRTKMAESNAVTVTGETGHPMTIYAGANGTVSPSGLIYANGEHLHPEITAIPASGYHFVNWTLDNPNATLENANAATTTITNASGACTITANFEADVVGHTVTYNYNGATSGASPASATGASVTLPKPTRTDYTFDGWYTTAGEKVGNGDAAYEPEADITLYARWQEACDAGAGSVATFNFNSGSESGLTFAYENETKITGTIVNTKTNDIPVLDSYYYNVSYSGNSSGVAIITTNSDYSEIDSIKFNSAASGASDPKITIYGVKKNGNDSTALSSPILLHNGSANNAWRTMPYNLDIHGRSPKYSGKVRFKLTTGSSGKKAGIDNIQIFYGGGYGTCRHIYYHGNGATSGFVSDTTSYADDTKATVLGYNSSRYPLEKTGNDFQGWATSAGGAVVYTAGEKITIDGADVHLYAKWAPTSSALVTWKMMTADNNAWATTTGTGTTEETNITSISTTHDEGSDKAANSATPKTAMAEAEVSGTAAPNKSARFTFTIAGGKQVEINKFDCKVFNVASGSRTYKAQISDAAGNVYNSTNTVAVSTEATLTDASFVFGSGKILRGAVTIHVYAWDTDDSKNPTEFRMGPDIKFYGTVEDYVCADPSAPTISGVSEYVPGETITLTASHDGENHDNLTTYTWYKGDTWGSKSKVQNAATGSAGYTFTKASCAVGDAGKYWCEVSNGTGCDAHNSEGYDVTVYPTYTITYNLNGGTNPVDPAPKNSYTQFDEDYTLPTPTKTGSVFAGWYGTSDFSGLPTVVLGSGSVGDKVYYAKWGEVVTVSWTVTKVEDKLYRGGGNYSVKAVIDQTTWNESYKDQLELTATEGVTLKNIVASVNGESKVQVTAAFDITTELAADATEISFTLSVPANGTYGPKVAEHSETLTSCAGGSTTITIFDGATMSDKTDADDISYKSGTEYTDGTTGFKYKCAGFKKDLVDVTEYTNHGSYSNAMKYGGNSTSYYISMTIPTGYTGSMEIVYGSTDKTKYFAFGTSNSSTANGSNGTKWNATTAAATTLYSATIDDLAAGTYYLLATGDKAIVAKIAMTLYATGGGITPTLTWDDGDADIAKDGVSKSTSNDDFIYTASQDKNSLGVITYSSSNATVATVNATTGQVHLVGAAGTATITATIAASGCFSSANVSYTITVTDDCDDEAGTIETEDLGCEGIKMTVKGHTAAASVRYQWYKVGTPSDAEVGTNQDNFTATEAGSYYVIVTNTGDRHCAKRSTNTITVEAQAAATVTKIVDSWYVKNGRRTPDIELVKTTNASSFTVTSGSSTIWESAGSTKTGFGGCGFHMDKNGIIYLNGTTDAGAATSGLTGGEDETLTITAIGCGSNASQNITIHKQAATDYKEIAFVVDGTKGGAWDAVTSGHADGTDLYEYLDTVGTAAGQKLFRLTERNIYSTTDEKAIRQHYSQFDGILITDDPSTNTVVKTGDDYKTKGYVNAFGTMVDVRPIFTMEAYVSALKNWGSKGIKGNPQSPNPRQYEMRLECKDHEIYGAGLPDPEDGTNVWEEVIDYETFRHVILVDSTKGIYKGVAYNAETAGKEKPALQGFTGEAAGSLLGLGRISNGTLQAAIERQEEPAARLLVMGINAKALQPTCALTNEGKTVIKNILIYLLKTNMEEVDDCSNYFTGKVDSDWSKADNWSKNQLPSSETKVRILAPCVISGIKPHVLQVSIVNSGNSNIRYNARNSAVCDGTLTIQPDGALIADGKIRSAVAPHFAANDLKPTTPEMLTINTGSDAQAALIFNNEEGLTKATVNYYSLGRKIGSAYQYQYFAIPFEYLSVSPTFANENHGGTKIYTYVYNAGTGWARRGYYDDLYAFEGLGITTNNTTADHMDYTMTGTLASTATQEVSLSNAGDGYNLVGNSWMAPIQIAALSEDNTDTNITKTAYIYCTGHDGGTGVVGSGASETPGEWLPIPFEATEFAAWKAAGKLSVIPAMQAFQIHTNAEATLTLDYSKVVRGSNNCLNEKLRAPRRNNSRSASAMSIIRVSDNNTYTDVCLIEGEQFSDAFDNGWEAKQMADEGVMQFYAMNGDEKMAVLATNDLEGTPVCFTPGNESNYTISFFGGDGRYYLNDLKEEQSTAIEQGNTYSFTYEQGDMPHRFLISTTPFGIPSVTTGIGGVEAQEKVQKVIYNDHVYIIRGGKIYDVMGKMMK